nr:hypothetical protein [Tanacetum cinerariifolium]
MCRLGGELGLVTTVLACLGLVTEPYAFRDLEVISSILLMMSPWLWTCCPRIDSWNRSLNMLDRMPRRFYLFSRLNKTRDILCTNEPVSADASISAVNAKIHVSAIPNVDSLSNAVIYSFLLVNLIVHN